MIEISDKASVRVVTLNRPAVRNALNVPLLRALRVAVADARADGIRCLVLTGNGKAFCAGADLTEWADVEARGDLTRYSWVDEAHSLMAEVFGFPAPTVALLNGAATGAGLNLALACDFRFAGEAARFACAYTRMGYAPDAGGTWLLPRLIGGEAAKRFVYTGEFWSAAEALSHGLVSEVHPAERLVDATYAFAARLAAGPTVAQVQAKWLIDAAASRTLPQQLAEERRAGKVCAASEDAKEALAAVAERREPNFKGR